MKRLAILLIGTFCLLCIPLVALRFLWSALTSEEEAWQILLAFDRLGNVASNGSGLETISSRADRAREEGRTWGCVLCRLLDAIQPNHCMEARQ